MQPMSRDIQRTAAISTAFGEEAAEEHAGNRWWAEDIVADRYLMGRDVSSVLSLCCGFGAIEQHMVPYLGSVKHCLALDIAEGAVSEAARRAQVAGLDQVISYQAADLNTYDWPSPTYDLVIANGALHHLAELERVLDGVKRSLKPGGILYTNEHIGVSHRDFSSRQLELINGAAYVVPPELRRRRPVRSNPFVQPRLRRFADLFLGNLNLDGEHPRWSGRKRALARILRWVSLPPRRGLGPLVLSQKRATLGKDPSEGVSSERIVPAITERFGQVRVHPYGGALLAYALDPAFYEGFRGEDPRHARILRDLCSLEASLVDIGELPHEHAIIIATAS